MARGLLDVGNHVDYPRRMNVRAVGHSWNECWRLIMDALSLEVRYEDITSALYGQALQTTGPTLWNHRCLHVSNTTGSALETQPRKPIYRVRAFSLVVRTISVCPTQSPIAKPKPTLPKRVPQYPRMPFLTDKL